MRKVKPKIKERKLSQEKKRRRMDRAFYVVTCVLHTEVGVSYQTPAANALAKKNKNK